MTRFTFSSTLIPLAGAMLITGAGMAAADDDDMARYIDMFEPLPAMPPLPADNTMTP